jgi:hypothetical protein
VENPLDDQRQVKLPDRSLTLPPDQEDAIVGLIGRACHNGDFVGQRDIFGFLGEFREMSHLWLDRLVPRTKCGSRLPRGDFSSGVNMATYLSGFFDGYLRLIKEWVSRVPAELIFKIDDCGLSDWDQHKNSQC